MDIATALSDLGVSAGQLTRADKERLDEDGFLPLPGILDAERLEVIRRRLAELAAAEGQQAVPRCIKRRAPTGWPTW